MAGDGPVGPDGCVPRIEICGNRRDENCDGRETSCGDNDRDGVEACRREDEIPRCDCDDARSDVRPAFGEFPPAMERCDGVDNDCNGRVDEAAACCEACAFLGAERARADVCTEAGGCDCSTAAGDGPCPSGQTCCPSGCVDVRSDFRNCGACGAACTTQADRCVDGNCRCGSGPPCDFVHECRAGSC
ncbi:MAG: MopE-related protein [Myxococcota bacterium]|nr:MopE-related protein [Myxococcota bacterium]